MNDDAAPATFRFTIVGAASPDLPLRILNLFAQQALLYDRVSIAREEDRYTLLVEQHGLDAHRAEIILQKIRAMVLVEQAVLGSGEEIAGVLCATTSDEPFCDDPVAASHDAPSI